jgi:hypothetical protein
MVEGKAPKVDDLFALVYSTAFEFARYARHEEHWSLTKEEASKLGKVSVNCLNTVPAAQKAKVEAKVSKYLPWISLIGFAALITGPRIALSVEANKEKKRQRFTPIPFPVNEKEVRDGASVSTNSAESVTRENGGNPFRTESSFPPGHGANFPPLDYQIPSPTDRKPS